ncbi:MAG: ASCH domain-containing protein [Pseudomonadota bacterium]
MKLPPEVAPFWRRFLETGPVDARNRLLGTDCFGDNQKDIDELAELVVSGVKRGTAPLLWSYEFDGDPPPTPGSLRVIVNWRGQARCVVETTRVDVVAYEDVTAEFAAIEGEGDGSLAYWQSVHWPYYERECHRVGKQPSLQMPILCEQFRRVFP